MRKKPMSLGKLLAEVLGTAMIVTSVLGAGFMTYILQAGYPLGLFMIAVTVGCVLFVAISMLGPISGAHFNPAVSLAFLLRKQMGFAEFWGYVAAQVLGGVAGAIVANLMFKLDLVNISTVERFSAETAVGEAVATLGLVLLILLLVHFEKAHLVAAAVGAWIVAGHMFTSSTSFANPAVTIGRMLSEAPSGIEPYSGAMFIVFQVLGALLALALFAALTKEKANG